MSKKIVDYRLAIASDIDFIIKTWIDGYKGSHAAGMLMIPQFSVPCGCGKPIRYDFEAVMRVTLAHLLQRPGVKAWVAFNPNEQAPNDLYAFLVCETDANMPQYIQQPDGEFALKVVTAADPFVHWVSVKKAFRGLGFARNLLKVANIDPANSFYYTCKTASSARLEKAGKMRKATWFPLSVRFPKEKKEPNDESKKD